MNHFKFLLAIILMLLVVVLLVQNHEAMSTQVGFKVNLVFLNYESSNVTLYHLLTIAFLFGVVISSLYGIIERIRFKKQIKILTTELRDREEELNSLRNLPITHDDVSPPETDET